MQVLGIFLTIYGILAVLYVVLQLSFAGKENHVQNQKLADMLSKGETSDWTSSIIVPVYNEDPKVLTKCLSSLVRQKGDIEVIVVDDGSSNIEVLQPVYNQFNQFPNVQVILREENQGKRHVQKIGFDLAQGEIIVTVDSDTILEDEYAVSKLLFRFNEDRVGAVTGDVRVENSKINWITRMTKHRYWFAFFQERAAQSLFGMVLCCSGPFTAYRKDLIDQVKDKYINEKFMGVLCTFGDDRHLTNLILQLKRKAVFAPYATAYTYVPDTFHGFVKQQVRWSKSFFRESFWALKNIRHESWYFYFCILTQLFLSVALIVSFALMVIQVVLTHNFFILWTYIGVMIFMALIRVCYAIALTKDWNFLWFSFYGFIHILLLTPIRIYALFTINRTHWGTR